MPSAQTKELLLDSQLKEEAKDDRYCREGLKDFNPKKAQYQVVREMKNSYRQISLSRFCRLLGVTRRLIINIFGK